MFASRCCCIRKYLKYVTHYVIMPYAPRVCLLAPQKTEAFASASCPTFMNNCQTILNDFDTLTKKCHIFRQSPLKTASKWTKPAHSSKESYAFLSRCHPLDYLFIVRYACFVPVMQKMQINLLFSLSLTLQGCPYITKKRHSVFGGWIPFLCFLISLSALIPNVGANMRIFLMPLTLASYRFSMRIVCLYVKE